MKVKQCVDTVLVPTIIIAMTQSSLGATPEPADLLDSRRVFFYIGIVFAVIWLDFYTLKFFETKHPR